MNTKKLVRYLGSHGCRIRRRGGSHDIVHRAGTPYLSALPRHKETGPGLIRKICADLNIPIPPEK